MIVIYNKTGYNLARFDTFTYREGMGCYPSRIALLRKYDEIDFIPVEDEKEADFLMAKIERQVLANVGL